MLTVKEENPRYISDLLESAFFKMHYDEVMEDKESIQLNIDHESYFTLYDNGYLLVMTLRKNDDVIGYFIGMIMHSLHAKRCLECRTDMFYIQKEHRMNGYATFLFEKIEEKLKALGVNRWHVSSMKHKDASLFFEKLNFKISEITYSKLL